MVYLNVLLLPPEWNSGASSLCPVCLSVTLVYKPNKTLLIDAKVNDLVTLAMTFILKRDNFGLCCCLGHSCFTNTLIFIVDCTWQNNLFVRCCMHDLKYFNKWYSPYTELTWFEISFNDIHSVYGRIYNFFFFCNHSTISALFPTIFMVFFRWNWWHIFHMDSTLSVWAQ